MQVIWQPNDIRNGLVVTACTAGERWLIGYKPKCQHPGNLFSLVSLSDGLVQEPMTRDEMAASLNNLGMWPEKWREVP